METKLEKEVRFLKIYSLAATLFCAVFLLSAFVLDDKKQKFAEIDVERINIVEKDGKLRMVISNKERQHPGILDGKVIRRPKGRNAGILFFNEIGDECGGLTFFGDQDQGQSLNLSFDKFRQDQVIQFQHREGSDGKYFAGVEILDRLPPKEETELFEKFKNIDAKMPYGPEKVAAIKALSEAGVFGFERVSVGKSADQAVAIMLADPKGRTRIKLSVDGAGTPRLEFLDESGKVIQTFPSVSVKKK
jgi:hypothetical protein